jgi:hypothetical protein
MSVTGFNRRRREMEALKIERQSKTRPAEGREIKEKSFKELRAEAKEKGIEGYIKMKKAELIEALKG